MSDDPQRLCRVCERPAGLHDGAFPCPEPGACLVPTGDCVLLRSSKTARRADGIELSDKSSEKYEYHVLAVGAAATNQDLRPGDRVLARGVHGVDWEELPGFPRLVCVKESKNVTVRWRREGE